MKTKASLWSSKHHAEKYVKGQSMPALRSLFPMEDSAGTHPIPQAVNKCTETLRPMPAMGLANHAYRQLSIKICHVPCLKQPTDYLTLRDEKLRESTFNYFPAVGTATRYGLDGPGIESRWGRDFPHPASYTMGTGSFPRVKRPGRGVDHPPHQAPRLKKE